jgi:hypothetical protein
MILYICTALSIIISTIIYQFTDLKADCVVIASMIGGILLVVSIVTQAIFYHAQVDQLEQITECNVKKKLLQEEADLLLGEFRDYLGSVYPNLEKEIIMSMKPEKVTAYMIEYPELHSSETISELVGIINKKTSFIYNQLHTIAYLQKEIRARKRVGKVWVIGSLIPSEKG